MADITLKAKMDYTEHCMNFIKDKVVKSITHKVMHFNREMFAFSIYEIVDHKEGRPMRTFKVDLRTKWCNYKKEAWS